MLLISFGKYNHSILFCHHRKLSAWAVFTCFLIIYNLRFPSIGQKSGLTSIAKNSSIHVQLQVLAQNHKQDNSSSTSTYIKEKNLNVYQIGVIKGENIPDKCI